MKRSDKENFVSELKEEFKNSSSVIVTQYSGLSVYDFQKRQSVIKMTKTGIERLGPSVITLSKYENLHGHANSVKSRIKRG